MADKYRIVKNFLLKQYDFVSIDQIIAACHISTRSFYNYVKEFQKDHSLLVETENKKYKLSLLDNRAKDAAPSDYASRKNYIFRKGLIAQNSLEVSTLLDYFGISDSLLHAEIVKIRNEIRFFHVRLVQRNNELIFQGNYHDIRKLIQRIIYDDMVEKQSLLSIDKLCELFPDVDVRKIHHIVSSAFENFECFMDEYSQASFFLHILISFEQEAHGILPAGEKIIENFPKIIDFIRENIRRETGLILSDPAVNKLAYIFLSRNRAPAEGDSRKYNNKMAVTIYNEVENMLSETYGIVLEQSQLGESFLIHIDSLIDRLKNNVEVHNPLLPAIKQNSPITYDLAVSTASIISKATKYRISESEIAYVALHIGARVEELRSLQSRLKTIIFCPEYFSYHSRLKEVNELFKDDLYIMNVVTSIDNLKSQLEHGADLLITTMPADRLGSSVERVLVSSFFSSEDRRKIQDTIQSIKKKRRSENNLIYAKRLFRKNLYKKIDARVSRDSILHGMAQDIINTGKVDDDFEAKILRREELAPTDFNSLAIPHPSEYCARETFAAVTTLDRPVDWGRSKVELVIMFAINQQDFHLFDQFFTFLIELSNSSEAISKLVNASSYESFISQMVYFIEHN